jgi:hypothetical protein
MSLDVVSNILAAKYYFTASPKKVKKSPKKVRKSPKKVKKSPKKVKKSV